MGAAPSQQEVSSSSLYAGDDHAVPVSRITATSDSNQAQSKRAPAPHMFQEIVAEEKKTTTAAALEDQVCRGIFLAGKTKVANLLMNMN